MRYIPISLMGIGFCLSLTSIASAQTLETQSPVTPDTLLPGVYLGQGSAVSRSWRKVAQEEGRFCVEIANGPPTPYSGLIVARVSSLSLRDEQLYVDATDFPLTSSIGRDGESQHVDFGPPYFRTQWLHQPDRALESEWLADCLASSGTYIQYRCKWVNGGLDSLPVGISLPLSSSTEALVVRACEQGANEAQRDLNIP